jgi:hypothetical protein
VISRCSNDATTRTDVRAPSGSYNRTTTSPEPSSASLTASTYAVPSTRTSGSTGLPLRRRRGRFSAYPASAAPAMPAPGTSAYRSTCRPWSVSGSGNNGARSRLSRTREYVPPPSRG